MTYKLNTAQEIYNFVKKKLLKQGEKSTRKNGQCVYRGPKGLKCAAGWLISNKNYSKEMEGDSIELHVCPENDKDGMFLAQQSIVDSGVNPEWVGLIVDLQRVHDTHEVSFWRCELATIANQWRLVP